MFDWDQIAYIKVLQSGFLIDDPFINWKMGQGGFRLAGSGAFKLPVNGSPYEVCIYLRKGKDFRTMPGGLNKISVQGYDPILPSNKATSPCYGIPGRPETTTASGLPTTKRPDAFASRWKVSATRERSSITKPSSN
jgi:hypothetical protein